MSSDIEEQEEMSLIMSHEKEQRKILVQGQCTGGLSLLSAVVAKYRPRLPGSRNGLFHFDIHITVYTEGIQAGIHRRNLSQELEARTEVESSKDADQWLTPSGLLISYNLAPHVQE